MNKKELQTNTENNDQIIKQMIFIVRGQKVMLDSDLARLYGVLTKNLRLQIGTSSLNHGGKRYLPYVFTEHGVAMLSSVLNSKRAIQMNIMVE